MEKEIPFIKDFSKASTRTSSFSFTVNSVKKTVPCMIIINNYTINENFIINQVSQVSQLKDLNDLKDIKDFKDLKNFQKFEETLKDEEIRQDKLDE